MKNLFFPILLVLSFCACNGDDNGGSNLPQTGAPPTTAGLAYSNSNSSVGATYAAIKNRLAANSSINIVAEVNHSTNALAAGLDLAASQLILFGNPSLGTPLMQQNQLVGLDLPQKILVYEKQGAVFASFNDATYLANRHDLGGNAILDQISTTLENMLSTTTGNAVFINPSSTIIAGSGIVTVDSNNDFETTYNNIKATISINSSLSIITELDHQANAASVNMDLRPTKLIVFGNPNLGSPLMSNEITTGIDLPQKFLVWENANGSVKISYNEPVFLAERHNISSNSTVLNQMASVLASLSADAAN